MFLTWNVWANYLTKFSDFTPNSFYNVLTWKFSGYDWRYYLFSIIIIKNMCPRILNRVISQSPSQNFVNTLQLRNTTVTAEEGWLCSVLEKLWLQRERLWMWEERELLKGNNCPDSNCLCITTHYTHIICLGLQIT